MSNAAQLTVHASCVVVFGKAVLIQGAAGTGKSSLALELMSLGAKLIADDRTVLTKRDDLVWASAPDTIKGLIEARGIGILCASAAQPAAVACVVDLDHIETKRLPQTRVAHILDVTVPCLHKVESRAFPAAVLQYLSGGPQKEM